jgi:hypothetical protein
MNPKMVKIKLNDTEGNVETLWAEALGDDLYRLCNSPFYAYGISWQDVIEARCKQENEFPEFIRIVHKSGNRTLRILLDPPANIAPESQEILDELVEMGCDYEGFNPAYLCVNVPAEVELELVCDYLTAMECCWEYADPTYFQLCPYVLH